jgi:hypothetical protein
VTEPASGQPGLARARRRAAPAAFKLDAARRTVTLSGPRPAEPEPDDSDLASHGASDS